MATTVSYVTQAAQLCQEYAATLAAKDKQIDAEHAARTAVEQREQELIAAYGAEVAACKQLFSAKEATLQEVQTALQIAERAAKVAQEALTLANAQLVAKDASELALKATIATCEARIASLSSLISTKEQELAAAIAAHQKELSAAMTAKEVEVAEKASVVSTLNAERSLRVTAETIKAEREKTLGAEITALTALAKQRDQTLADAQSALPVQIAQARLAGKKELWEEIGLGGPQPPAQAGGEVVLRNAIKAWQEKIARFHALYG